MRYSSAGVTASAGSGVAAAVVGAMPRAPDPGEFQSMRARAAASPTTVTIAAAMPTSRARLTARRRAWTGGWGRDRAGQRRLQRPGAPESLARVLSQRALDHANETVRQIRTKVSQRPARTALIVESPDLGPGCPLDGVRPGHQEIEQHAEAVDVGCRRAARAREDLGREVNGRAGEIASGRGRFDAQLTAGSEIHQHGAAAVCPHHVVCLDVPVQEPGAVHRGQRATQVHPDERRLAGTERALIPNDLVERFTLDQFHRQPDFAADSLHAEDPDDARDGGRGPAVAPPASRARSRTARLDAAG